MDSTHTPQGNWTVVSHKPRTARVKKPKEKSLGAGDSLGARDSYIVEAVLPAQLAEVAFSRLREEVKWAKMYHRGGEVPRLVAVEGEVHADGSFPIYRHPSDESPPLLPFSPTVAAIREHVQKVLPHPVNHVLIQHYRTGADYISDHSDKTIDVVRGSNIVNVSLGAQRVMTLRMKKDGMPLDVTPTVTNDGQRSEPPPRPTQRIPLPHNSMFVMGLQTNAGWLHGIGTDKRPPGTKSPSERAESGERISLTFRTIGTFLTQDEKMIYGQGAKGKTRDRAQPVVDDPGASHRLIRAFAHENQEINFDWDRWYGAGSNVHHFGHVE